jgi:hypothetical protein
MPDDGAKRLLHGAKSQLMCGRGVLHEVATTASSGMNHACAWFKRSLKG